MPAIIIDGKKTGCKIETELIAKISDLSSKFKTKPGLAVILAGDDKPSHTYVNLKKKKCAELGIHAELYSYGNDVEEKTIVNQINILNTQNNINGILVQLPLPKQINVSRVINSILPEKDVDGFHPLNIGKLALGEPEFIPCTPFGVQKLFEYYDIPVKGKNAVIIGCSNVVGKPMGLLLQLCETATCTICHILTKDLREHTIDADIIISAAGVPNLIKAEHIKKNAVVIDVGFNETNIRNENGDMVRKICGDVDYANVIDKCSYITPVPGGVGPMTISMLMCNTVKAWENQALY